MYSEKNVDQSLDAQITQIMHTMSSECCSSLDQSLDMLLKFGSNLQYLGYKCYPKVAKTLKKNYNRRVNICT